VADHGSPISENMFFFGDPKTNWRSCYGADPERNATLQMALRGLPDAAKELEALTGKSMPSEMAKVGNVAALPTDDKPVRLENPYNYDIGQTGGSSGGWDTKKSHEKFDTDKCDIDHVDGGKIDFLTFARKYAGWNRPVKIKAPPE